MNDLPTTSNLDMHQLYADDLHGENDSKPDKKPLRERSISMCILCLLCAIFTISLTGLITLWNITEPPLEPSASMPASVLQKPTTAPQPDHVAQNISLSCGTSRTTALSRGCIFDLYSNMWVPRICFNQALYDEVMADGTFLALRGWAGSVEWFVDREMTLPVEQERLQFLEPGLAYTKERWHAAHCLYMWRLAIDAVGRRVRSKDAEVWVNARAIDQTHTEHCNEVVADQDWRQEAISGVHFGYGHCVLIQ